MGTPEDLALVLSDAADAGRAGVATTLGDSVSAAIAGRVCSSDEAVHEAARLIRASRAPAIVGLNALTIEAAREAVALAERMRGRLLPWPLLGDAKAGVIQTATLGHVFASDIILWVGCNGGHGPTALRIAERQLLGAFSDETLATVLRLRESARAGGDVSPITQHKRVAVVLPPTIDPRVASQWHSLAADLQQRVRVCVFTLPANDALNTRGVHEVITWQTGVWPGGGGVDFADGAPHACAGVKTLFRRNAIDLLIDAGSTPSPHGRRIALSPQRDDTAAVAFAIPGLAPGLAARVMRSDGVILWLCDDPAAAPADPAVARLAQITAALGGDA